MRDRVVWGLINLKPARFTPVRSIASLAKTDYFYRCFFSANSPTTSLSFALNLTIRGERHGICKNAQQWHTLNP